jgi:hypothetical protein
MIDTSVEGYPICTDGDLTYAWVLEESSSPWDVDLTLDDVSALLSAALVVFATVFCVRMVLNVILNRR